jgi:hypothetical protein
MKDYKDGDLQVWWVPQIPMPEFIVDVDTVEEGVKIMDVLAQYDLFQLKHRVKGDYSNMGGLRRWCEYNGDGTSGWEDWYDEETFEDDPRESLLAKSGR